jgi:type II restriction enzyme
MIRSIESANAPSFLLLHYHPIEWIVRDLFLVPRHFLSPSMIEKRAPLRPTAERAGWLGCNILLSSLPPDAKVDMVKDGIEVRPESVRETWHAFSFLRNVAPESRGWMADVLACVRDLRKSEFTLHEVYEFEERLGRMHKGNQNVRPKIRQQLQVLRDRRIVEFLGRGKYRVLILPQTM